MAKALFLTYNTVGDGSYPKVTERNGHSALIVQHPRGQRWGASVQGRDPVGERQTLEDARDGAERREMLDIEKMRVNLVNDLYAGAFDPKAIDEVDFIVIYVGAGGSEGAIELAATLPKEKVRFLFCDCNLGAKHRCIVENGLEEVPFLVCECGGRASMAGILEAFLETGNVGPVPALA